MALSSQDQTAYQQAFQNYLGRQATAGELAGATGNSASLQDQIRGILTGSEFANRQQQNANNVFQPQFSQLGIAENQTNDSYANALQALEQRQAALPEQVMGQFNRRGIARSGIAAQGLGQAMGDINRSITSTQQNRAYKLADLASQRAQLALKQSGYVTDLMSQPLNAYDEQVQAQQKADLAQQAAQEKISNSSSTRNTYNNSTTTKVKGMSKTELNAYSTGLLKQFDTGGTNKNVDYNPEDTGDKTLSQGQAAAAYADLLDQVGGNQNLANQYFKQAWTKGGYQKYLTYDLGIPGLD